jgi:hypothetical protein
MFVKISLAVGCVLIAFQANAQFDLGKLKDAAKQMQKEIEGNTTNQTSQQPPQAAPNQPKPTSTAVSTVPNATPNQVGGTLSATEYCKVIKSDATVQRYLDAVERAAQTFDGGGNLKLDTHDDLLFKWAFDKMEILARADLNSRNPTLELDAMNAINECADTLMGTKYEMLIRQRADNLSRKGTIVRESPPKTTRKLDESGNLVVETEAPKKKNIPQWVRYLKVSRTGTRHPAPNNTDRYPAVMYALIFEKGQQAFANIAPPVIAAIEDRVAEAEKRIVANKAEQEQRANEEKRKAAEGAAKLVEIRNGNYAAAESCFQISQAFATDNSSREMRIVLAKSEGLSPSVQPTNQYRLASGELESFKESKTLGFVSGEGYMRDSNGRYGVLKTQKSTHWIKKDLIRMGNQVVVVGKYVSNSTLKLVSGASTQAPVLELICIEAGWL